MFEEIFDELGIDPNEEVGTANSEYVPTSQFPPPPPIGNYDLRGEASSFVWGRDKDKNLYLKNCKFAVVGGEFDGKKVDGFISNRVTAYRKNGTDMEDFLRAGGVTPKGEKFTNLELVEGIESTFTAIRRAYITWEGYCKPCGKTVARGKAGAKKEYDGFTIIGFQRGEALTPIVACPLCAKPVQARAKAQKWYVG